MATRGLNYIKPYVLEFERSIRLYLDDNEPRSYISANLIDSLDPSLVEQDSNGQYVVLNLIFNTLDGVEECLSATFDVTLTYGNEFVLGNDLIQSFSYGNEGIILDGGEVRIYSRG